MSLNTPDDALLERRELSNDHLAHAARADICRRLGRTSDATASYHRALSLAKQEPERRFLEKRLQETALPHAAQAETLASRLPSSCGFLITSGNPWPDGTRLA